MSEIQIKDLKQQFNDVGVQLQQKGQPLQQNMQRRSNEEREKLVAMILQAVGTIAEKEGYDMVLNRSSVPYAVDGLDISQQVLDEVSKVN